MLMKRIIVCLDVQEGRVVKGVNFRGLRDVGNPVELAQRYEAEGADDPSPPTTTEALLTEIRDLLKARQG